jgi:hypothetical protein
LGQSSFSKEGEPIGDYKTSATELYELLELLASEQNKLEPDVALILGTV